MSEPPYRHITHTTKDGVVVIKITETELRDYDVCDRLRNEFVDVVDQSGTNKVVLDFGHVEFVASVMYLPLLSLSGKVSRTGGRIVLSNLSEMIAKVFLATRLLINRSSADAPFQREATVAAAIANLNGTPPT
jgi:anti-anti-sigma factor